MNLILFFPLLLIFITILENYLIDNPKIFIISYKWHINNHNIEVYNKLVNNLNNDEIIFLEVKLGIIMQ